MKRPQQIIIGLITCVALVSIGGFLYLTRAVAAPTIDVQSSVQQLEESNASTELLFRISQVDSEASYTIEEVLNGVDTTVVGITNEVAGDILINLTDPASSQVGEIAINARTFQTDEERRDNSVARFILQSESDENEFIVFNPTNITGLPETITMGEALDFKVDGELTVAGSTNSVTFDVTATLLSEDELSGSATTVINYADFGLSIPELPFIASVEDTVTLGFTFVADVVLD